MDLVTTIQDLIKIRTVTGNATEIKRAAEYIKKAMAHTDTLIEIFQTTASPVIFLRNTDTLDFDVIVLGHIDVVPAADDMFNPVIKDGKLFGRGALDMKSFAAVALNSMEYVVTNRIPLKFGVILSTDEETGSSSLKSFLDAYPQLQSKIVLDNDVGGDITKIISKCKNPVYVKLTAVGREAHGSTPWDGIDANELLMKTWQNIRQIYPYYASDLPKPNDTWFDTVHFAKISGGNVDNIISDHAEALLDFRLTETSSIEKLKRNLIPCMEKGVTFEVVFSSNPVVMSETNPDILDYKQFAENVMGEQINFEHIGGATDSRAFALKGSTVIMHSGTGDGMHSKREYVVIESVKQIADIQIKFLEHLAKK